MKPDFSGWATRSNLKCSDGRTIKPNAFIKQSGTKVPLVWQHKHGEPTNVLGHAVLEDRDGDIYTYGFFNNSDHAKTAKLLVEHGDISSLSIFANKLVQKGKDVLHGVIREVSLVLSGANPGAFIDNVSIAHAEGYEESDTEAVIYTGLHLEHEDSPQKEEKEMADEGKTVQDVFDGMSDEQKNVVYFMIGEALKGKGDTAEHDDMDEDYYDEFDDDDELQHGEEGYDDMSRNVFEQNGRVSNVRPTLDADQVQEIMHDAMRVGSLKESVLAHSQAYGINDIDLLFPDAKAVTDSPDFIKRRTEWVAGVLTGVRRTPFSRIKSLSADITQDTARALGYIKGNMKKEEFFGLASRSTTPKTIYKKQKLDRDDIVDVTTMDIVAWLKAEMRIMLDEEIARAILIGDGRDVYDDDKIDEDHIRPIATDDDFYTHKVSLAANVTGRNLIKAVLRARKHYKGTGNPVFFTTEDLLTDLLLIEDRMGRRLYETEASLASALRVSRIIPVAVMEGFEDDESNGLLGVMVNLRDYTVGADKGGQVSMFDDFDIDFNQQKYLMETRISGALVKPKAAIAFWRTAGTEVTPLAPSFDGTDVTIPTIAGVIYVDQEDEGDNDISGTTITLNDDDNRSVSIMALPDDDYYFPQNINTSWVYNYDDNL